MSNEKYEYNSLEKDTIYIKEKYKKKGKEYGFVELDKSLISILVKSIDLMSVSPSISAKFSEKIEKFIMPRYTEINEILYIEKESPTIIKVEISKENQKEMLNAFTVPNVITGMQKERNSLKELINRLKSVKFFKLK